MTRASAKAKAPLAASYAATQRQAEVWSDAVLRCRTRGHSWEQTNSAREGRNYVVWFDCTRECGVRKTERWNNRGVILKSHLAYPKDTDGHASYLSEIGFIDREAKGALRLAALGRAG